MVAVLEPFTGVVLAGGAGTRMGLRAGQRKPQLSVGGRSMLERACGALLGADLIVVVGDGSIPAGVLAVTEDPAGGGPVAGLAAALQRVVTPVVLVLAADLPLVDAEVVAWLRAELAAAPPEVEAVVPVDPAGRLQPLVAAYRSSALVRAVDAVSPPRGRAVRDVLAGLHVAELPVTRFWAKLVDVDTPEDLTTARVLAWATQLAAELTVPLAADQVAAMVPSVLDIARDAAHQIARPAAPVTTFLAGVALGARIATGASTEEALTEVSAAVQAALGGAGPTPD